MEKEEHDMTAVWCQELQTERSNKGCVCDRVKESVRRAKLVELVRQDYLDDFVYERQDEKAFQCKLRIKSKRLCDLHTY